MSGSHLRERSDEGGNPQRCYDPSDDRDGTAGVPSTQPVLVREPTSAFSSLGRLVLSSMLDAKEQGAQRPEESTIIPFSESRYRSSDRRKGALTDGRSPSFYKCDLRGYSFTILCFAKSFGKHGICAHKVRHSCLMGTPHTPLYARRTVRITGTSGGFPSPRKAAPTQRIMMPSSPERERSGLCPLAHPSIHPITPATSEQAAGALRPKRWGGAPFSINEGRPQWASPASLKDKRREEYHQTRMVKPFSLNSHRTIYAELPYKLYGNSA